MPKWYIKSFLKDLFKSNEYKYNTLLVEIAGCFSGIIYYFQNKSFVVKESRMVRSALLQSTIK